MPHFKVRGKAFAINAINHHGDGKVALWLATGPGAQALYTEMEPEYYFVPPYVGAKGWLGVELNKGLSWKTVGIRIKEAYAQVAARDLLECSNEIASISEPVQDLSAEQIDPLLESGSKSIIGRLDEHCGQLPEVSRARQFGNPVWKAGKKSFVCVHRYDKRSCIQLWVGVEQQGFMTDDPRFKIPAYVGHNGWIDLDVEEVQNWAEIDALVDASYRHFALKRMLKQLDETA